MNLVLRAAKALWDALRQGFDVFGHTVSLAVLSLALAVTVWFFVIDVENEEQTDFFSGAVPVQAVNVPQGLAVARLSEPTVAVRISADKDVWDSISIDDFTAVVDLSGVNQREADVPVRVRSQRGDVKVVDVEPPRLTVSLESLTTRTVPVTVKQVGAAPLGYRLSEYAVSPETVDVTGPESLVGLVDAAVADVNLTNMRVSMEHEFVLAVRDKQGGDIVGVSLSSNTANVSLTIVKEEYSVVFVVNPSLSGNVAAGYEVADIQAEPAFVSVQAPAEILQSIETLTTEDVAVDGAESDVVRSVKLRLPEGAHAVGGDEVVVRVIVTPAHGETAFSVQVQVSGAGEGVGVALSPSTVLVMVAGDVPYLKTLTSERFTATVDVSDMPAGTHSLPLKIALPADVQLLKAEPGEVVVTIPGP